MPNELAHVTVKLLPEGRFRAECGTNGCIAVNPQQLRAYVSACLAEGGTVEFDALAWKLFNAGQEGATPEPAATGETSPAPLPADYPAWVWCCANCLSKMVDACPDGATKTTFICRRCCARWVIRSTGEGWVAANP